MMEVGKVMLVSKYKIKKLRNGLRVLLVPNKYVDSVNISVLYRVGSRCEEESVAGMSHFLEHMFFKGTKKRPKASDISVAVDSVGGQMNAFTSYEYTGYYIKVAKKYFELASDVLSDMMLNSSFRQKELEKERMVIKEEMKMYEDNPLAYIWRAWNKVLYQGHGLGRDISGTRQALDSIDHEKMLRYRDNYYSISNALLVVVGNYSETKIIQALEKNWAKISKGKKSYYGKYDHEQQEPQIELLYKDIQQANFCVGFKTYETFHPDHFITKLISVILGQGMSSRLFLKVRERKGLAYSVSSMTDNYTDVGNLVVKTGTDVDKASKALGIIIKEFVRLKKEKVNRKELQKAKEYWKGNLIISMEDNENLANLIGMQELLFDKIYTPKQMMDKIDAVNEKDIIRVANDIFVNERLNLAMIGPYKNMKKFDSLLSV
ncbi:insulinase family protein [Patescibacteria group bacterium]|nr:insulinase family protein [Patescibacteria group bacterium]